MALGAAIAGAVTYALATIPIDTFVACLLPSAGSLINGFVMLMSQFGRLTGAHLRGLSNR